MSLILQHQEATNKAMKQDEELQSDIPEEEFAGSEQYESGIMQSTQLDHTLDASLKQDLAMLKGINSRSRRAEVKQELIEKYRPYIDRLKTSGDRHEVQGWFLVWLFDTENISFAIDYGTWCIANKIPLPERFNRATDVFVVDAVLEWANGEFEEEKSIEPYFSFIFEHADGFCSKPWNLPDEVTAKLYRLHGLNLLAKEKFAAAADALSEAFDLGAKVKTPLGKARRKAEQAEDGSAA
jgi:hypothetical protein